MASASVEAWLKRRRGGMTPGGSLTMARIRAAKWERRKAEITEFQRERATSREPEGRAAKSATSKGAKTAMATHVESKEKGFEGISQTLVDRYGEALLKLLDPRSPPQFSFVYDRSAARDGSDITTPFPCSRHRQDNWKRGEGGRGWVAIQLVCEHNDPHGGKWREVQELPADLRIAGELA